MKARGEEKYFSRVLPEELPSDWETTRLSTVCSFQSGTNLPAEEREEGEIPVYGSNGIVDSHKEANTGAPVIIIGRKGSAGAVNYSEERAFIVDVAYYIDPNWAECDLKWLYYLLLSLELEGESEDSAIPGMNRKLIGTHKIPLPPHNDQRKIAEYLDRETRKIDQLIEAKAKMMEYLNQHRNSTIADLITQGSNEQTIRKESEIPGFGEIPAHWDVVPNKAIFEEVNDKSEDGKGELLSVSEKTGVTLRSEKDINMFESESLEGYKTVQEGDLVINTMWAWKGAAGIAPQNGLVSPSYHVYRPNDSIVPEFADYLYRAPPYVAEMKRFSEGVWKSRNRLYPDVFLRMDTVLPPKDEQREIVDRIKSESKSTNELTSYLEDSISFLKEKRQSLITKAVTGQIDIGDVEEDELGVEV